MAGGGKTFKMLFFSFFGVGREMRCEAKTQLSAELLCCQTVSSFETPFETELEGFTLSRVGHGHSKAHCSWQGMPRRRCRGPGGSPLPPPEPLAFLGRS